MISFDTLRTSGGMLLPYFPLVVQGTAITLVSWLMAGICSVSIGIIVGTASCRYLTTPWITRVTTVYTFVAKGIPLYVQILIAYFVLPAFLGINLSGFVAGLCALTFCSSGYVTEIIRSGINTIPQGQWEACVVLGYPLRATLTQIILPQTCANILPTLLGEIEQLLKSTSLLATIGVLDLTRAGMNIISRELNPVPVYCMIACLYLIFSFIARYTSNFLEKRMYYDYR